MERQQQAPVLQPFFGRDGRISEIWQRWFQKVKTREDEIRKKPNKVFTTNGTLTTWDMGKTILFNTGSTDLTCNLMTVDSRDIWGWVQIVRMGTGKLTITADSASRIEYSSEGGSVYCEEVLRRAANITLQIVATNQWAILAGLGTWTVD